MSDEATEQVYVLGTADGRTVKIGRTINLARRVGDIQRMSPAPLYLLWSHPGGHELETNLHRQFSALRTHGEWFSFTNDALPLIRWAVAEKPWLRPRVSLKKRRPRSQQASAGRARVVRLSAAERKAGRDAMAARSGEMDATLAAALDALITQVRAIEDPLERYRAACEADARVKAICRERQRGIANDLKNEGRSWREVGELLNVSGQRAFQIATGTR